jgi:UDP-glucuronate 4-epimerase
MSSSPRTGVLVTGCAGFIGMHAAERFLAQGIAVTGVDSLDPYYDVALKEARLARLVTHPGFRFVSISLMPARRRACSRPADSGTSFIWLRNRASGTRWSIRERISRTT